MRTLAFASRNLKELIRDPMMAIFSVGFPVVLLLLFTAIQSSIPVSLFALDSITPGLAAFGLSFISLFSGMLLAKDRSTSFLMRLFASPLTAADYMIGYMIPLLPIAVVQSTICFLLAFVLGLPVTANVLLSILVLVPTAVLFIGIGLMMGSLVNDKAVGGISSIIINVSAWLSGTWFDIKLVGGTFKKIADILPFVHSVNAARAALSGDYASILPNLAWVSGYAVVILVIAVVLFRRKMSSDKI